MPTHWIYDETTLFSEALRTPARCLKKLRNLHLWLNRFGDPSIYTGSSGITFRMDDSRGRSYAIKVLIPLPDETTNVERFRILEREVNNIDSPYFIKMKFYEDEFSFTNEEGITRRYCVIKTDWVEGLCLNRYFEAHCFNRNLTARLAYDFCNLAAWLHSQPFAHGYLETQDIIVRPDNSLVLIDYDDMYFPSLEQFGSNMDGRRFFYHPERHIEDFNSHLDDFPLALIAFTAKLTFLDPYFWDMHTEMPLDASKFQDLSHRHWIRMVCHQMDDKELQRIYGLLLIALSQGDLRNIDSSLFLLSEPIEKEYEPIPIYIDKVVENLDYYD